MTTAYQPIAELLTAVKGLVELKIEFDKASRAERLRQLAIRKLHLKQASKAENLIAKQSASVIDTHIDHIVKAIESKGKVPKDTKRWTSLLVDSLLPVSAVLMAEASVAQLLELGVNIKRIKKRFLPLDLKESTAERWLSDHPGDVIYLTRMLQSMDIEDVNIGLWFDLPDSMKQRIADLLAESFNQPYWEDIALTTSGHANDILQKGLAEGFSIRDMASRIRDELVAGGEEERYAMNRARNIARTESANALNGARSASIEDVKSSLPSEVSQRMIRSWMSVLGTTTRDSHASLDGVPEDKEGKWLLAGMKVPWPGYFTLPPEQRCNCACSVLIEWGMSRDEASDLINEYYGREESNLGKSVKHLSGQHDQSSHGSGGGTGPTPESDSGELFDRLSARERSVKEARKLAKELASTQQVNPDARKGVKIYSREDEYERINQELRGGKKVSEVDPQPQITEFGKATSQELSAPVIVYRGLRGGKTASSIKSLDPGDEIESKGFTSTSLDPEIATGLYWNNKGVVMEIRARRGLSLSKHSDHPGESEITQPPGARYKFLGVDRKVEVDGYDDVDVYMFEEV